jgi:hypothetical protein
MNYKVSVTDCEGVIDCVVSFDLDFLKAGSTEVAVRLLHGRGYGSTQGAAFESAVFELWAEVGRATLEQTMGRAYDVFL